MDASISDFMHAIDSSLSTAVLREHQLVGNLNDEAANGAWNALHDVARSARMKAGDGIAI